MKQHQWNLHRHRLSCTSWRVVKVLSQHSSWHPSIAWEVRLHCLPCVPKVPFARSAIQKSGDVSRKTKSSIVGGLMSGLCGISTLFEPINLTSTFVALSNFSLIWSPTSLKCGSDRQHVWKLHDPVGPWHLQGIFILFFTACWEIDQNEIIS